MTLTKEQFKRQWESTTKGTGITMDTISDCAKEWGIYYFPENVNSQKLIYNVLKAANTVDYEYYNPGEEEIEL